MKQVIDINDRQSRAEGQLRAYEELAQSRKEWNEMDAESNRRWDAMVAEYNRISALSYDERKQLASDKWNAENEAPACYVQEVRFTNGLEWRICGTDAGLLGYIKLAE